MLASSLAALALCCGCGVEQLRKTDGGAADGPAPITAAASLGCPAAVVPGQAFERPADLAASTHPDAPAPAEPPLLRLDLSAGRVQAYTSETAIAGPNPFEPGKDGYTVRERVELKGAGGHLGRYLIHRTPPAGFPGADAGEQLQGLVVDVGDDTTIHGRVSQELELQLRFPLPPAPLSPGVAIARPVRFPIDSFGAFLHARGTMTFMLDRYVNIDGHRGIEYRVKVDIHDVDRVPEVAKPPTVALEMYAVVVFDLDDRSFVEVRSRTSSKIDMFPGAPAGGELGGAFSPITNESRTSLTRDPARSTAAAALEPPVPAARCGVVVTPGVAFTVPAELAAAVTYPDAPAPASSPQIRWDFAGAKVHAYAGTLVDPSPNMFVAGSTETRTFATWLFHSQGDGLARHVAYQRVEDPGEADPKLADMFPVVLVDVAADSTIDGRISQEAELRLRFPVPPAPLVAGEPISAPFDFPLNIQGAMFYGRGTSTYQLDRYVQVDGHLAAQYSVKTEVRAADPPPEVTGRPDIDFEHIAVAVFDLEDGSFVAVHSQQKQRIDLAKALPGGEALPGGAAEPTTVHATIVRDPSRAADPLPRPR